MRILCTADVHIRNYSKFTKWDSLIPERLSINLELAQQISDIAGVEQVNSIIIAGDLLDIAVSPPMVLNVVDKFLSILSEYNDVYITQGQHDISTKTVDEYLKQLTTLTIFESDKIHFHHNEVVTIGNKKVFFYGWSNIPPEFKDADMFVGHGMVQGSKNVLNYTFQSGYDPGVLSKKYKFSVIGDIHKQQDFYGNVLIPGPPIQNSFKDDATTGVWVIDDEDWSYEFYPLENPKFPKFFYVNDKSEIPTNKPDNYFYQALSHKRQSQATEQIKSTSLDLWSIIEFTIKSIKDSRHDSLLEISKKVFEDSMSSPIEARHIPQTILKQVTIKNFFSIQELDLTFPEGLVSVVGDIGTGKSTFLDAICWGLYGVTTKGKFKDDLIPVTYKPTSEPTVIIEYSIADNIYRITRTSSSLIFEINNSQVTGSRMSDTQAQIEDVIQITYSEFSCLVYFSQDSGSFFGNLKNDQQMSLMTMFLSQQDQYLDKMISSVATSYKKYMNESLKIEGAISNLVTTNERNFQKYNEYKSYQVSLRDRQIEALQYSDYKDCSIEIIDLLIQGKTTEAINRYFDIDYDSTKSKLAILKDKKSELVSKKFETELSLSQAKSQQTQDKRDLSNLIAKIKSHKSGVCSECKQSLPIDDDYLAKLIEEVKVIQTNQTKYIEDEEILDSTLKTFVSDIEIYEEKIKDTLDVISKADTFKKLKQSDVTIDPTEMKLLQQALDEFDTQKSELESQKEAYKELYSLYEVLHKKVFTDKGIKARCVEYIGQHLSDEVNSLLDSIDSNIRITINTVTYNKSGGLSSGFDVIANFNGTDIKYRNASGGQKMLIDVSSVVSIYNLLSSTYNLPEGILGFLAMDESIRYLDTKNIDTVRDIVGCIRAKTVFVVSHDEKLSQILTDRSINVKLENGISMYQVM